MEVFSEGEGKGCSFLYRIPMTRQPPNLADMTAPTGMTVDASAAAMHGNEQSFISGTNRSRCAHTLRHARGGGGAGGASDKKSINSLAPPLSSPPSASSPPLGVSPPSGSPVRTRMALEHVPSTDASLRRITSSQVNTPTPSYRPFLPPLPTTPTTPTTPFYHPFLPPLPTTLCEFVITFLCLCACLVD